MRDADTLTRISESQSIDVRLARCDGLIATQGDAADLEAQPSVARAYAKRASLLQDMDRHEDAAGTAEEMLARFGKVADPELRRFVATFLFLMASSLEHRVRLTDGLVAYRALLKGFDHGEDAKSTNF